MAKLDKLLIHGVRSFGDGDREEQLISFYTPLTLILGQNGCGKTTIIESLKVATCGEYPPGSAGGKLFVHDPKCNNKVETKAHIKLKITDANQNPVEVDRHFKVTQRSKTITFSSVEQNIKRLLPDGSAPVVSGKCVQVDTEMCEALGVSKAILNYVIFCHQEDSSWPLDEGKKVKERFDEIFDSTKYNKCLDAIDKKKKAIAIHNKILDKEMSNLRERKDIVTQKRQKKASLENQVQENQEQVQKLIAKLEPIYDQLKDIAIKEENVVKINTEHMKKKTTLEGWRQQQQALRKTITTEFTGTTDELKDSLASFNTQLKEKEKSLIKLEERLHTLIREESGIIASIGAEQVKVGQLQTQEEQNKQHVNDRNIHINRMARDLDISGSETTQFNETQVTSLVAQVKEKVKENAIELEEYRTQLDAEEQHLQTQADQCRDAKVKLEHDIASKKQELATMRAEARKVRADIEEVDLSAGKLARVEARLERAQRELDDVGKTVDVDALKRSMEQAITTRKNLEDRLDTVSKEVRILTQRASDMAELESKRKVRDAADNDARKLRNKHSETLTRLLKKMPEEGFKYELQACQEELNRDIKLLTNQLNAKQTEVTKLEANQKHQKALLQTKDEELRVSEETIYQSCGSVPYEDKVKTVSEDINKLQDQVGTLSASGTLYRRYIAKLQQRDPCCPLCSRGFPSSTESGDLMGKLQSKLREFPKLLAESRDKLATMSLEYDKLQQLKTMHTNTATLKHTELPRIRRELAALEVKLALSQKQVEELDIGRCMPQVDLDLVQSMQGDIVLLDKHQAEVKRLNREIERDESQLPPGAGGRSMAQALAEQEKLSSEVEAARRQAETTQNQLTSHSDQIQALREQKNVLVEEKLKIQGGVARRQQLTDRLTELQILEVSVSDASDQLLAALPAAKVRWDTLNRERDAARVTNRGKIDKARTELVQMEKRLQDVNSWQRQIDGYERRGISAQLAQVREKLTRLQCDREKLRQDKEEQAGLIAKVQGDIASQQTRERDLRDNLDLRKLMSEERTLAAEVHTLSEKLRTMDYKSLQKEKARLGDQEMKITREKNTATGRRQTLEESVAELDRELRKPLYKSVEADYSKVLAELAVKTRACVDLQRFSTAMDGALIRFHQEQMKSVNDMIRGLWRTIYRGNDIDFIEIKTDSPEANSSGKRRTYNYRVVQRRGNAELDMRGRCSAGQRVLACLIIRLALAETFSASCGIMALDEPTTNLDQVNIDSLGMALAELVNVRMKQKNFQLIVITHNEDFLHNLCREEDVQYYHKVERNASGKSIIRKLRVT